MTRLSDRVYSELKRRLTLWEYAPGRHLPEDAIAAEFSVSRTPVREALRRLEREGFLDNQPHVGYRAPAPDLVKIEELYEIRLALEEHAVGRLDPSTARPGLQELLELWGLPPDGPGPRPELVYADEHFHESLAGIAGNASLVDALRSINDHIRIIRVNDFVVPERIADTYTEHRAVLTALLAGDVPDALLKLRLHIRQSQSCARAAASRALSRLYLDRDHPSLQPLKEQEHAHN